MSQALNIQDLQNKNLSQTQAQNQIVQVGFDTMQGFDSLYRMAKFIANSTIVPKSFQGKIENCMIAINMANRMGADPLMVMQNLYVVYGTPSWSAKFLIATFNQCRRFSAMKFSFIGEENTDSYGCFAHATELATGEQIKSSTVTIAIAKAEGWYQKDGSKWKTMPQQMLMYRAAAFLVRVYAPELSMGLQTMEEIQDIYDLEPKSDGSFAVAEKNSHNEITIENVNKKAKKQATTQAETVSKTGEVLEPKSPEAKYLICPKLDGTAEPEIYSTQCQICSNREGCPAWE